MALYERLYGLSGVSLRLGNVYGPRQDPLGEAGVIAIFCGRLRAGERPTVFGDGAPDPRLHICGGRGRARRWPPATGEAGGAVQHRHRPRDERAGAGRELARAGRGPTASSPSSRRPRAGEVQRISIDPARAAAELGWRAADRPRGRAAPHPRRDLTAQGGGVPKAVGERGRRRARARTGCRRCRRHARLEQQRVRSRSLRRTRLAGASAVAELDPERRQPNPDLPVVGLRLAIACSR